MVELDWSGRFKSLLRNSKPNTTNVDQSKSLPNEMAIVIC